MVEERLTRDVRRFLWSHAGDVEVVSADEGGTVSVRFTGACSHCPKMAATFGGAIVPAVRSVEGVSAVRAEGAIVSPHAMRRLAALDGRGRSRTNAGPEDRRAL
jgi:Fe-S cluster biogenesis protein NfuA